MFRSLLLCLIAGLASCTADKSPKIYAPADISIPAMAGDFVWKVNLEESSIDFEALEKRNAFTGYFKTFNIAVNMDPENPEYGEITAVIDLNSVSAGNADRDDVLKTPEWFYLDEFPSARFHSTNITRNSSGGYEARGKLSIKDVTKDIVLSFMLDQNGSEATATAKFEFNRLDYHIGVGSFSDEKYVSYPVKVFITVKANR